MIDYAPITIFCYRRPKHLARTIQSLMLCQEFKKSPIILYCDGPKSYEDESAVLETRKTAKLLLGDGAEYVFQEKNLGLANSIILGVTNIVNRFGHIIVMEDDLLVSPFFLRYINDGLKLYKNDDKVASIHGYSYPVDGSAPETYFLKGANCWGWGTWSRAWKVFNPDGVVLAKTLKEKKLIHSFDYDGAYPYYKMLNDQIRGKNNSWAIRWHASAFLNNMLTLYPGQTLVENIGMDGSGEHCKQSIPLVPLASAPILVKRLPISENHLMRQSVKFFMILLQRHLWVGRLKRYMSVLMSKVLWS